MNTMQTTHLSFNGNAKEAMKFYQSILGGTLRMQTYGEVFKESEDSCAHKIIHAHLDYPLGRIIARDKHPQYDTPLVTNRVRLVSRDETMLSYYFTKLMKGGRVDLPLTKQLWGDAFGMLTDKFGVPWHVHIVTAQVQENLAVA